MAEDETRYRGLDQTVPATPARVVSAAAAAGERGVSIERYRLGNGIGRGGMGRVVEAFDTQLGRTVALKEVLPGSNAVVARRFLREVQITARLEHASIVPLYDSGRMHDGRPFYVMRRVSGRPLDELIRRASELADRLALLPSMLAAIDAIGHAHRRRVIHRDLKPSNILVGELGETVVIDWGLAKVIGEDDEAMDDPPRPADSLQTQVGSVFGTPGFMSPEQARGEELGPRSDVYALGATLYHLLVGRPPAAGASATEMIESAQRSVETRVTGACPGAPPELAAIVDKALSPDPGTRYGDAAALAEDVRRFLTGQLVAAHRYTTRQRLARFVRRHRAPISVAILGLAALGVLAVFSVRSIVQQRDAAHAAEAEAVRGQAAAEDANRKLQEQTDQLRVWRAEALVERNPTAAMAALKQVSQGSPSLPAARAVAQAAALRGVPWALKTDERELIFAELSPDTRYLAESTLPGGFAVYNLDARRQVLAKTGPWGTRAVWADDGRQLLVCGAHEPSRLIDAHTGAVRTGGLPIMNVTRSTSRGDRVLYVDDVGNAGLLDVKTATTKQVGDHVTATAIARDGSWYALGTVTALTVYDRDGKVIGQDHGRPLMVTGEGHRIAVLRDNRVRELTLDSPSPRWVEVPLSLPPSDIVTWMMYRDETLLVSSGTSNMTTWNGSEAHRHIMPIAGGLNGAQWIGTSAVSVSLEGRMRYVTSTTEGELELPMAVRHPRLVGAPGKSRFVVAGIGVLLVYDFDQFLARRIPVEHGLTDATFVDDELLLAYSQSGESIWYDLAHDTTQPGPACWGSLFILDVDPANGRALVDCETQKDSAGHLIVAAPGVRDRELATISSTFWARPSRPPQHARFVPGGAVVWSEGARVLAAIGDRPGREVARLDGQLAGLVAAGPLRVVALGARGELSRIALTSGAVERTRVELTGPADLAVDLDGRALVSTGTKVYEWTNSVRLVAQLPSAISTVHAAGTSAVVVLGDGELFVIDRDAQGQPRRVLPPAPRPPVLSRDGSLAVGVGNGGNVAVVEVADHTAWALPWDHLHGLEWPLAVAPGSRRIARSLVGIIEVTALPQAGPNLADWLDSATNAQFDRDGLRWPWELQQAKP